LQRLCLYVNETAADFGTGLRAHLGLELGALEAAGEPALAAVEPLSEIAAAADAAPESAALEALATLEYELVERERLLALREASLAARSASLLAAAQALYDEIHGGPEPPENDELARMRRRRSGA
jgi:hypothetical protein